MGLFESKWERTVDNNLFDYIEVGYFYNYRFTTVANYMAVYFGLLLQTALYAVDVYTCVKLLAFNEWSSQVKPYLSFRISKWLFAACIICSIVLLVFDTIRGTRVYLTRNISLIYTNSFAKTAKSLRYKYHCVLNEINPPEGFDKMAFYTYFTLSGSKKLILADSPRQVINALTLYSVFNVEGSGFWDKLKSISTQNRSEAVILYSMFVSFVIWIFFIGKLFFALIFMFPVYHRIRGENVRSMKQYVCLKVDETVKRLAKKFAKKRLLRENRKRTQENLRTEKPSIPSIPSIPTLSQSTSLNLLSESKAPALPRATTLDSLSSLESSDSSNVAIDVNPFKGVPIRKPPTTLKNSNSSTSLASSYTLPQRPQELRQKPSQISLLKRYPEAPPPQPFYTNSALDGSLLSIPESSYEYSNSVVNGSSASLGSQVTAPAVSYPSRDIFLDEEKNIGFTNEMNANDVERSNDDGDYDSLLDDDSPQSRKHVRPSLIIRAQDMESEDYFKLRPAEPQSYVPDLSRQGRRR